MGVVHMSDFSNADPRRDQRTGWFAALPASLRSRRALADLALYLAVRLWIVIIAVFPVETNLRTARWLGSIWWALRRKHRDIALTNLRSAFGARYSERQLRAIAKASFQHFAQVYLVELAFTPRVLTEWSWARYVEFDDLGPALRELISDRGVIMLTAHFGNFELMGYTIARLGLPITAIMRPLDNPRLNDFLVRSRAAGGVDLLFKRGATEGATEVIESGGALCFIADQDAGRKCVFADFFGRQASWYKSIGLLAMQYRTPIIVGHAARVSPGQLRYRVRVDRIIQPEEWQEQAQPLQWLTQEYASALEVGIRAHPEQYLWMHNRWKTRPKEEAPAPGP